MRFLTGFTGEAGDVVITADHAGLWTDTRYFIQARRQLEGTGVQLHKMRVPEQVPIPQWIASLGLDGPVIAVDGLCQSVSQAEELQSAVPQATIVPVADILSPLWPDRPAIPTSPVITLGEDIAGESRETKLRALRKWLVLRGSDAVFISQLDQIAWLLNVRGQDVEYNPVVISYLLVTMEDAFWFVRKDAFADLDSETEDSFAELAADSVSIRDYTEAAFALASLRENGVERICVDPSDINLSLRDAIDDGDSLPEVEYCPSPVPLMKAVKNPVEIDGMKEAHLEDGLAMEQFLFWVQRNVGLVDEWQAAQYLGSLRARIPGYRGDSFGLRTFSGAAALRYAS